jgi:hypothetical protein
MDSGTGPAACGVQARVGEAHRVQTLPAIPSEDQAGTDDINGDGAHDAVIRNAVGETIGVKWNDRAEPASNCGEL